MIAWTLATRELRSGVRGLRIVLACLALGVAAIAAVGSLRAGIEAGLASEGRRLLGGDIEVQTGAEAPSDALLAWLRARGATLSTIIQMRSMLVAANGQRQLVELKVVDDAYPLIGNAALVPERPLQTALRDGGLVAEPLVLERLGVNPGDSLRLGRAPACPPRRLGRRARRRRGPRPAGAPRHDRRREPAADRAAAAWLAHQLRRSRRAAARG